MIEMIYNWNKYLTKTYLCASLICPSGSVNVNVIKFVVTKRKKQKGGIRVVILLH